MELNAYAARTLKLTSTVLLSRSGFAVHSSALTSSINIDNVRGPFIQLGVFYTEREGKGGGSYTLGGGVLYDTYPIVS